jgi:hypothetical protein
MRTLCQTGTPRLPAGNINTKARIEAKLFKNEKQASNFAKPAPAFRRFGCFEA